MQTIIRRLVLATLLTLAVQPGRLTMAEMSPEELQRVVDALDNKADEARYDRLFSAGLCSTITEGSLKGGVSIGSDVKGEDRAFLESIHRNRLAYFKGMEELEGNAKTRDAFTLTEINREKKLPKQPPAPDEVPRSGTEMQAKRPTEQPPEPVANATLSAVVEVTPFTVTAGVFNRGVLGGEVYEHRRTSGKNWQMDAAAVKHSLLSRGVSSDQVHYFWNSLESPPGTLAVEGGLAAPPSQALLEKAFELAVPPAMRRQTLFLHVGEARSWAIYASPGKDGGVRTVELPFGPSSITEQVNSERKPDESFIAAANRVKGKIFKTVADKLASHVAALKDLKRIVMSGNFLWSFRTLSGNGTANAIESFSIRAFNRSNFLTAVLPNAGSAEREQEASVEFITRELYSRDQLVSGAMLLDALNASLNLDRKRGEGAGNGYPAVNLEVDRLVLIKAYFLQTAPPKDGGY